MQASIASKWNYLQEISNRQGVIPLRTWLPSGAMTSCLVCLPLYATVRLSIYPSLYSHSHLYSHYRWAPTLSWKEQCTFVHQWPSHLILIYLEGRLILFACFYFGCCSHHQLYLSISAPYCLWPFSGKHLLWKTSISQRCHLPQGTMNFFAFAFPASVLGRGSVGRTSLPHSGVWDRVELICIGARLLVREGGNGETEMRETASLPQLLLLRRKEQKKYISACLLI